MFLIVCSVAVTAAAVCYAMFNSKKVSDTLRLIRFEGHLQLVGSAGVMDDFFQRRRNRLGQLPVKTGQVAVITGGARGIGVEVIKVLVKCGMTVVMGIRKPEAGIKMAQDLKKEGFSGSIDVFELDVSSLKSVDTFSRIVAKEYPKIDLLINNAGIMFVDYKLTDDGFESQLATNYLGHFYLTHMLMPNLKAAGEISEGCARIVNVTSCAHYPGKISFTDINMKNRYISSAAYSQSKLAQLMSARYLDKLFETQDAKVRCYSVHPGVVNTELFDDSAFGRYAPWMMKLFFKTPKQGAIPILYACFSPKVENRGGLYISNCRQGLSNGFSKKEELQKKLFEVTCDMVHVKEFGKPAPLTA